MSEEYDLKKSEETVGQLLPVIKDAKGRIVDGLHRTKSNSDWRVEIRKEIETDEDYWKARAHLNFSRRNAQDAHEEKKAIINNLAKYYESQGKSVSGEKLTSNPNGEGGKSRNEILDAVIQALDGAMTSTYIRQNIDPIYTQDQTRSAKPYLDPANISPLDALAHDEVTVKARYGEGFTERLRKQVLAEAKLSPQEKAALTRKRQQEREEKQRAAEIKKREKEEKKKLDTEKRRKEAEERETENQRRKVEQERIAKEKKRAEEEKRKEHEAKLQEDAEKVARQKLLKDADFQNKVIEEIQKKARPTTVKPKEKTCSSGTCAVSQIIGSTEPERDVRSEQIAEFWNLHSHCLCKNCEYFTSCTVIR